MNRFYKVIILCAVGSVLLSAASAKEKKVRLSEFDLSKMSSGWGTAQADKSIQGKPLTIGGRNFAHGVGSHAGSVMRIRLDGRTERFTAFVGVDDETGGKGSVRFRIYGNGKKLYDSTVLKGGDKPRKVDLFLSGVKELILLVDSAGDGIAFDHADWAEAEFQYSGKRPLAVAAPVEPKIMLTPKPAPAPRINDPELFGARPGHPFIFRIPCTGKRPITFSAVGLPLGLVLNSRTGIITGHVPAVKGNYPVTLKAVNSHGTDTSLFRIVVGDKLALTPPMGWNSWYIHYNRVTEKHLRGAADTMIKSGMADFGYMYVNIDDCWMKKNGDKPYRDESGAVLPNKKFPDMAGMVEHIHSLGLRAGLYTSPGPWTCGGYVGAYKHEENDAHRFAGWGFDFLKYDWCSYGGVATGKGLERLKIPYRVMGDILKKLDRDIVLNLCQYGMGEVWKWGGEVGGNCWRTTGDLGLARGDSLPGFYHIGLSNALHDKYAGPGEWNDPDYILIGWVGNAHGMGEGRLTSLTPNEQYSYMSMWSLMAAPLIFSGDMSKLDEFTLNVLCNAEVISVDQDILGRQGKIIRHTGEELVLAKPLKDGSFAVGLFNLSEFERTVAVTWDELNKAWSAAERGIKPVTGPHRLRDLWRQKDIGSFDASCSARLGRHGVALFKISR